MTAVEQAAEEITHCAGIAGCGGQLELVGASIGLGAVVVIGHILAEVRLS